MIPLVKGLTQDELSAVSGVAEVKPVGNRAPIANRIANYSPCGPRVHAAYHDVSTQVIARVTAGDKLSCLQMSRDSLPL